MNKKLIDLYLENRDKYKTDKYELGYIDNLYTYLFDSYKNTPINFLEIGVQNGDSILMWKDYFHPDSQIHTLDIRFCEMIASIPNVTSGCVMDMCKDKKEISFKIRTGDISPKVLNLIKEKKISPIYMNQLIAIFDKVRTGVMFRERLGITDGLTRIELKEFGKKTSKFKLVFVDFGDIPFPIETKETAIYLIFLNLPNGIKLKDFDSEIEMIVNVFENVYLYKKNPELEGEELEEYLFEQFLPSKRREKLLTENISNINKKLNKVLPKSIAAKYHISGSRGEKYKIELDRELVDIRRL